MKVLRVITRLNIGGPAIQAIRLTTDLRHRGVDTTLVHGRLGAKEGDMRYLLPPVGADLRYVPSLQRAIAPLADAKAFLALLALMRRVRPDIVHTHMAKAGLLGRMAALVYNRTSGRRHPAKIVHTYHGHVLDGYFRPAVARAFVRLERWLARDTDVLVAISPRIRDELVQRFRIAPERAFQVVPLGFDLTALAAITDADRAAARRRLDLPAGAHVVATVGRLTAIKRHDLLLDAVAEVTAVVPRLVLLIAGDGELRQALHARAQALGLNDRIRWLGWRRDLETIYGAADVFALTSDNEGTPVALIEAMAAGTSSVSTNVGGVADVVTDRSVGMLVPPDSPSELADALIDLIRSAELRREMGARARQAVIARYGLERLLSDIDGLYRSMLA